MNKEMLAKKIYEKAHLVGNFKLRSGLKSNEYFDKYLFESSPEILSELAIMMKDMVPEESELLAGLEMGGIPIATAISIYSGKECIFVRKQEKSYGTCKLAEGSDFVGKKVCVVEDVVTTGGQILRCVKELRDRGANIDTVICAILRNNEAIEILKKEGLELRYAFSMKSLKQGSLFPTEIHSANT